VQKLRQVLEAEEGSRQQSGNLFKAVTCWSQGNISALSRRSMKLKGSLNYRDHISLLLSSSRSIQEEFRDQFS